MNQTNFTDKCTARHNWITGPKFVFDVRGSPDDSSDSDFVPKVKHKKYDDKATKLKRRLKREKKDKFDQSDLTTPMLTEAGTS